MKRYLYIIIMLFFCHGIKAGDNYYYYKGTRQPLSLDRTKVNITVSNEYSKNAIDQSRFKSFNIVKNASVYDTGFGSLELTMSSDAVMYAQSIESLKQNKSVIAVHPNYITSNNDSIGMSSYFYVRLKKTEDYPYLEKMAKEQNVTIVEQNAFLPLWYTLRCTKSTPGNTLETANSFFETGYFSSAVPDFLSDDLYCSNDPDFSALWGLKNNSYPGIDINICSAWGISEGNGVKVAVLDQGIELTHNDLRNNIFSLSYDTESNSSPSQIFGDHGTHCAGTIGAVKDNNLQVVGVAPKCKLMSVSNSLAGIENSRIKRADGINWAWQNGADIISNSWGSSVEYDIIDEAIENALLYGRNGKGTIVVFASGNDYYGTVGYPARTNPDILVVGAINNNGTRASFSNYGTALDVVAPGVNILSTILNNGTGYYDGTSMATPHVAGVAALVISRNPELTGKQVRDIIESTSKKVGGYAYATMPGRPNGTWNSQMGYGLVDAYAAVQQAACPTVNFTNRTVTANTSVTGCDIYVQNVTVNPNVKLTLEAQNETMVDGVFEVKSGGMLDVW